MMNSKRTALIRVWTLALLANGAAFGQPSGIPKVVTPVLATPKPPTITILSAASGALVRSLGVGNASVDLGRVSYFKGTSTPGESSQRSSGALVITTRFALRVDCPGSSSSSQVNVTVSRMDASGPHAIAIDGTKIGTAAQTLVQSMPCGSGGEHRLDMVVPASEPAGSIGSTVAFVATINR